MKPTTFLCSLFVTLGLVTAALVTAGPLSPPAGPVAPSYKTLNDVEPRIPISAATTPGTASATYRITAPGSYYLTGNLTGESGKQGIAIFSSGVTLDLSGFSLFGGTGTSHGIYIEPNTGVTVRNGRITGWAGDGINAAGNSLVFENVTVEGNAGWGMNFFGSYPGTRISGCVAGLNTNGGINAPQSALVERCVAYVSQGPGIVANSGSRVEHCVVWSCNPGISLVGVSTPGAFDNSLYLCSLGISSSSTDGRIERNHVRTVLGYIGLRATAAGNVFKDNIVTGVGDKYDFVPGNRLDLILSQIPESIDWPAHVTLQGSLTGISGSPGITVNADDVTIDLGGHTLSGVTASLDGITVAGSRRNTVVMNGNLSGWGGSGVDLSNASAAQVSGVHASGNLGMGIAVGASGVVRMCQSLSNAGDNIRLNFNGRAENCTANGSTAGHGINANFTQCTVLDCTANGNALSGIRVTQRGLVSRCTASDNVQNGVHITFVGTVEDCFLQSNDAVGILMDAGGGAIIRRNHISESPTGIRIATAGLCRVQDNTVLAATTGYLISSAGSLVQGNACGSTTTPYNIAAGNTAGPIVTSGTIGTATNPFANVSY